MSRRARPQPHPRPPKAPTGLLSLPAPPAPPPPPRIHRLHRSRGDHRHLQIDPAGAPVRSPVHGAGAGRRSDRGRAGAPARAARRGRAPERDAPLHSDARRARGTLADLDLVLARQLRERSPAQDGGSAGDRQDGSLMALEPFDIRYEADLPAYKLPADLHHLYGRLGFADRVVYSNFLSSLDGVVTLLSNPSAASLTRVTDPPDP